ncbi:MAG: hypothetical protein ABIK96_03715 [bacterium]
MTFRRRGTGPLLSRHDIPAMPPHITDPSSVFNPGAVMLPQDDGSPGRVILLLRVQTRGRKTFTVPAATRPGKPFRISDHPVEFVGLQDFWTPLGMPAMRVFHVYDPRITMLDGELMVTTAVDTERGCRLAIWRAAGSRDGDFAGLERLELIGFAGDHDTRNGVLFPVRQDGRYLLLERPNKKIHRDMPATGDAIVLSSSPDLVHWRTDGVVLKGRPHFWDELIGSGPPPVLTEHGWLHLYHGVATHFQAANIYQVGAVLLDRDDPTRVLARTDENLLEPRELWELTGQVPSVVFPSGMFLAEGRVHLFYGAADTAVGYAVSSLDRLVAACRPVKRRAEGE